jgi:hypothetical protein
MKLQSTNVRTLALVAATVVGVFCGISAPANALAVVDLADTWLVTGTFNDGGTLSGYFTIGPYGYLNSPTNLTTTAGDPATLYLPGQTYSLPPASSSIIPGSPPASGVYFSQPSYIDNLQLVFLNPLVGPPGTVDLLNLDRTLSYECYSSYAGPCNGLSSQNDPVAGRYFISAEAVAAPLPSTWMMLLGGFVGLGFLAFRGTKKGAVAIAAA